MNQRNARGFTLFELLIVISILLALGAIVTVSFLSVGDQAEADIQRAQFDQIDSALERFRIDMKRYPTEDEGIAVLWDKELIEDEADLGRWRGIYISPIAQDNWNHEIIYRYPGELLDESTYDLVSVGPDGEENTEDDVTNHDRRKNADGEIESDGSFPSSGSDTATG